MTIASIDSTSSHATPGVSWPAHPEKQTTHISLEAHNSFLALVEQSLERQLGGDARRSSNILTEAGQHLCLGGGGKRARPLLVRVFGDVIGVAEARLVPVAVAAELIHSSSLLHDDVVDSGMMRRGRPTVNARWGNSVAVLAGDLMLSQALLRLSDLSAGLTQNALEVIVEMTQATIAEVESRGRLSLTREDLRSIALGKTGALFGFCGRAVAELGGSVELAERLDAFGRGLGVAFQAADDVRDMTGTDPGKARYADLYSKTPNLPLLVASERSNDVKAAVAHEWQFSSMTYERAQKLGQMIATTGAVDVCIEIVERELTQAIAELGTFGNSEKGRMLTDWARHVVMGTVLKKQNLE